MWPNCNRLTRDHNTEQCTLIELDVLTHTHILCSFFLLFRCQIASSGGKISKKIESTHLAVQPIRVSLYFSHFCFCFSVGMPRVMQIINKLEPHKRCTRRRRRRTHTKRSFSVDYCSGNVLCKLFVEWMEIKRKQTKLFKCMWLRSISTRPSTHVSTHPDLECLAGSSPIRT